MTPKDLYGVKALCQATNAGGTGRLLFSFFLSVFFSSLSLFPLQAQTQQAPELETVRLQLKWRHQFQFAGYYAAIKNGYYEAAGLKVELLEAEDHREPAQVVLDGDADFGIATSDLVLLWGEGAPIVVLAPIFQHSPLVFLVKQSSGIDSVHGLAGKRIMLEDHAAELLAFLHVEGVSEDNVHIIPHAFEPGPLITGAVDGISAYLTDEPFLLRQADVAYWTLSPRTAGIDFYGDTLFTTQAFAKQHPETVARFLEASMKGWEYALDNVEVMANHIYDDYSQRHSVEHLLFEGHASRSLILPDVVELGYNNPGRWRHIAETYASLGLLRPNISLDGFLYTPDRTRTAIPDWVILYIAVSLAILTTTLLVGLRFHKLHERIHRQSESLKEALDEIKVLRGIIPICAYCKQIRDDEGSWNQLEKYIAEHSEASFSHGICDICAEKVYGEMVQSINKKKT